MSKEKRDAGVALDTMVVIYALRSPRAGDAVQRDLSRRARILLAELDEEKSRIIVPTVSVAELLLGIESGKRGAFMVELQQRFHCPSFGLEAAALAADLWSDHRALPQNEQLSRKMLKVDVMIVATAKTAGATRFFSHDAKCRKLAERAGLPTRDLPQSHPNLFIDRDLRHSDASDAAT